MDRQDTDDNILVLVNRVDDTLDIPADIETPIEADRDAQVWAFQGVHGGAGVTSLAVQTAYELANPNGKNFDQGDEVLLIDLDFERGNCAAYMDIQSSLRIEELNSASGRMDQALARTFIRKYTKNLSVIVAEGELGGNDYIDPAALLSLLDAVSTLYDYIILDVPLMWRSWTQAVIAAADKFALVTEVSVPSLHKTKELNLSIMNAMELTTPPQIILNKFERRSLRGGVTLKDAIHLLDREDLLTVTIDEDIIRQSINSGQPAGKFKADSRYSKSVRQFVQTWIQDINALKAIQDTSEFGISKIA
jgi:pilus assembly protein CpaE